MINLDFTNIRIHGNSKNEGFEELVCQLAHLSPPANAQDFFRKDGAGGDGGIECFWILKDGSEHGWQAKYFPERLESSEWNQINKSVVTALDKHPKLTKYYVCIPRDWTDSRKPGKKVKTVISALDKWNAQVAKWQGLATAKGMNVEFHSWTKHDIALMLNKDEPKFAGRARYWFGTPIMTSQQFAQVAHRSKDSLGDRFTPDYHLDLPIADVIESLGRDEFWQNLAEEAYKKWIDGLSRIEESIIQADLSLSSSLTSPIRPGLQAFTILLKRWIQEKALWQHIDQASDAASELEQKVRVYINKIYELTQAAEEPFENARRNLHALGDLISDFMDFLGSDCTQARIQRAVLLDGEAGIGKSHLLCDIALKRIADGLPTLFVLGQHYMGGNPMELLKNSLDLRHVSDGELLGALDAAGEAHNCQTLIMIDAINEGHNREYWPDFLGAFLKDIQKYERISIVISCRTTYLHWLVPEGNIRDSFVPIKHQGFKGYEHRAAAIYLSKMGIAKPSAPVLAPEFTNPLLLKVICLGLKANGQTSFPKGMNGITSLLTFYLKSIEKSINKIKGYRSGENVVETALEAFAVALYPNRLHGMPMAEAVKLINSLDSRPNSATTLFDAFMNENILAEDSENVPGRSGASSVIVRFSFERFSDQFIAASLAHKFTTINLAQMFDGTGDLAPMTGNSFPPYMGILAALSVIVAEKFQKELLDLLPDQMKKANWVRDEIFIKPLIWRTPQSFTERTKEIFNSLKNNGYHSIRLNILLQLSSEPSHPWNADFLHKHLMKLSMPQRDLFWSTHITISDFEEQEDEEESILRTILNWGISDELKGADSERLRLCAIILIWIHTTSNRRVRDQATKSAVHVLIHAPEHMINLFDQFSLVDDLYVVERLYAIAYGVVTNIDSSKYIKEIALWVWKHQFVHGSPQAHILLRDYARGILEFALHKGLLEPGIVVEDFRPPYKITTPLTFPSQKDIDVLNINGKSEIHNSLMGHPGDFGNYTLSSIHQWSATPVSSPKVLNAYDLKMEFAQKLNGALKDRFILLINKQLAEDSAERTIESFRVKLTAKAKRNGKAKATPEELLKADILKTLDDQEAEYFQWLFAQGQSDHRVRFSRKKAQKWICARAFELGWTEDFFAKFERSHVGYDSRRGPKVERIGKKYQWIALHEFMAHLSDQFKFIDSGHFDDGEVKFDGPWQINDRDVDPTFLLRSTGDKGWDKWEQTFWWQPFIFPFYGKTTPELQSWLKDNNVVPPFEKLLTVTDTENHEWLVLRGYTSWRRSSLERLDESPYADAWHRINACIIKKPDIDSFLRKINGSTLCDPNVAQPSSSSHGGFYREYPWHPFYKEHHEWRNRIDYSNDEEVEFFVPTSTYDWESGSRDHSLEASISIYQPSRLLVEMMSMTQKLGKSSDWLNNAGQKVFFDPSVDQAGPSTALIDKQALVSTLDAQNLQLVWLVTGEKNLHSTDSDTFYGRVIFSGAYTIDAQGVSGSLWFKKEFARKH